MHRQATEAQMASPAEGIISVELGEPNEIARFTSWDLDFRQIGAGPGATRVTVRQGRLVTALSIEMRSKVHQIGAAPADFVTFGVPKSAMLPSWRGTHTPLQPMVCFGNGREFDGISEPGFAGLTVSMRLADMEALADDFGLDVGPRLTFAGIVDLSARARAGRLVARTITALTRTEVTDHAHINEEETALAVLLALNSGDLGEKRASARARERALRRALDVMEADIGSPPSIRELCVRCDTSWPTLYRAFMEQFGVGPKKYAMARRLSGARRDLIAADPAGKVADIANQWGFWHMGQFAADYRKLFGERPSEHLGRRSTETD